MKLDEQRHARMIAEVRKFFATEWDDEISPFKAEQVLRLFLRTLGPELYNQGVHDAQAWMQAKLEDLDADVYPREEE